MRATFTHLLIAAALLAAAETKSSSFNLVRTANVFGWQDNASSTHSRSSRTIHNSYETSLKRNENSRSRKSSKSAVINASSSSKSTTSKTQSANHHHHPLNNIKIMQPRKKELWLPWPLGELRNDYYRFAEQQKQKQHVQSQQQQRIKEYYSDDNPSTISNNNSLIRHGREWAGRLIQRGQSLSRGVGKSGEEEEVKPSNYWVKETTTPMATASASMKEERQGKKRNMRGGDTVKEDKKWDNEIIMKYVKLQMKVRLRQLGYGTSTLAIVHFTWLISNDECLIF